MTYSRREIAVCAFAAALASAFAPFPTASAYPPGVGITSQEVSCLGCHVENGPWKDEAKTIIDIVDSETRQSLRQEDGVFVISARRGQTKRVLTVIGRTGQARDASPPYRNAWLYIDPSRLRSASLSKFAPGWMVDLPMSCRVVGDKLEGFEDANITVLPMTVRPLDDARETALQLQVMLTRGESVKGDARKGMLGNYFERKVLLRVID